MRLPKVNAIITHKRRTVTSGNKKEDVVLQQLIPAFISDTGTTSDHEQTYMIMISRSSLTNDIDVDKDSISDGNVSYRVMNSVKKTYHYSIMAIKAI